MRNIKFLLTFIILGAVAFGSAAQAAAKEKKVSVKNDLIKKAVQLTVATTTPSASTTTPPTSTSTPPTTATTTLPVSTTTPPVATSTPPAVSTTTPPAASTTPPVIGRNNGASGQVNGLLGQGFLASNYYSSPSFGEATTRALKLLGFLSAIFGLVLLGGRAFIARIYP